MTESALRELADELSTLRRGLSAGPDVALAQAGGPRSEAGDGKRGASSTGRARLRESPVASLFRATDEADGVGAAPVVGGRADEPPRETEEEGGDPHGTGSWLEPRMLEAEPRSAKLLASSERQFGPEHPRTLWAVHDLATALANAGELAAADRLAARLVSLRTQLLGPDHPHTARAHELRRSVGGRRDGRRRPGHDFS